MGWGEETLLLLTVEKGGTQCTIGSKNRYIGGGNLITGIMCVQPQYIAMTEV